jgi:hypothetical protein
MAEGVNFSSHFGIMPYAHEKSNPNCFKKKPFKKNPFYFAKDEPTKSEV